MLKIVLNIVIRALHATLKVSFQLNTVNHTVVHILTDPSVKALVLPKVWFYHKREEL